MNVRTLLAAFLVSASFGCIEAAPEAQNNNANNVQNNNVQTNNGQTNNQTNNVLNNNVLNNNVVNNSNNLTNNTNQNNSNQNNVVVPWHNDVFTQRIRFDIDLQNVGGGFVTNVQVAQPIVGLDPANVAFIADDLPIGHDYEAGSTGSFWMRTNGAPSIWMYFDPPGNVPSNNSNVWGGTAMFHFAQSNIGYNANQSGQDFACEGTCLSIEGLRGSAFDTSNGSLQIDTTGTHPAIGERVTFLGWLGLPQTSEGEPVIMASQGASNLCGWELVTATNELLLRVRNGNGCAVAETLSVSYPEAREGFFPLTVRIQRTEGAERVALQLGDQEDQVNNLEVPRAELFQIGPALSNQLDELQIIPAWVDDGIIVTHIRNLTDENAVIQNEVEFRP